MSLLDSGRDVVTVFVEVETTDEYDNVILAPGEESVEVAGRWQPSTAEESAALGQEAYAIYRFISRTFPAGPYGQVEFDGKRWEILAPPRVHRGSATTAHVTTYLKER